MLKHIGLQYSSRNKAEVFFTKVLEIPKTKEFTVSAELGESIFGIKKKVEAIVFGNAKAIFEVFIGNESKKLWYDHICLEVPNKERFISLCKSYGIETKIIRKGDNNLLFIRDFSGYLYEIKGE